MRAWKHFTGVVCLLTGGGTRPSLLAGWKASSVWRFRCTLPIFLELQAGGLGACYTVN